MYVGGGLPDAPAVQWLWRRLYGTCVAAAPRGAEDAAPYIPVYTEVFMNDLIYNQNHIPLNEHRYGFRPSAQVGCGWVATHNALRLMGYKTDIDQLIRYYEWQLPLIHGNAGTSFWGPAVCFRNWGFPVELVVDRRKFDEAAKNADACILFYRWHRKTKLGAHFVALHHTEKGFVGYNTYKNSTGPDHYGESLDRFLREKHYFGCVLLTIRKK